jgi:hypothetical protein
MRKLEKTFANCGCMLRCVAVPLTGNCFHAKVEIIRYEDQALLVTKTFVSPAPFRSSTEAIECARAWSVNWVRQNG